MTMAGTSGDTDAWIRRFHPAPEAPTRLVCFPHAGGAATYYFPVSRQMAPSVDVLAVQYPGRQDRHREPCVEDLRELADLVTEQLRSWTDRPCALFGHSMGATVAFEVALRMQAEGAVPVHLFASGRRAPSRHRDQRVHLGDDEELIAALKRMSGTGTEIFGDEELLRMILPTVRSDYKATETYRYREGPLLECPVTVLTGDEDSEVTMDEARAWSEHTRAAFDMKVFPGGHFYLNEHAPAVMDEIRRRIG